MSEYLKKFIDVLCYRFGQKYLLGKFELWEKVGIHIIKSHYYHSPIPNLEELRKKVRLFGKPIDMVGFDWNEKTQIRLMQDVFPLYPEECSFPQSENDRKNEWDYFIDNWLLSYW